MKLIKYLFGTLLSLLVLSILLLPTLVSTNAGKEILLQRFGQKNPDLNLSVQKLSLSWFGGQKIEGIKVQERSGLFTFSATTFASSASLLHLLWNRPDLTHPFPLSFSGTFTLSGGRLNILKTDFEGLEGELLIPSERTSLLFRAWGTSVQENEKGNFTLCTLLSDLKSQNPSLDVQIELVDLPIKALDQIAGIFNPNFSGILVEGIGPTLNLTLHGDISKDKLDCDFKIGSTNLQGSVQTKWQEGNVALANPGNIQLLITPALADKIAERVSLFQGLKLKKEVQAALSLRSLALPLSEKGLDINRAKFQLDLKLAPTTLLSTITTQEISLDALSASLSTSDLQDGVDVDMSTVAKIDGMQSRIQVQGKLENLIGGGSPSGSGKIEAQELSLILLDEMFKQEGMLVDFLGKSLNAELDFVTSKEKNLATLQLSTPNLSLSSVAFTWDAKRAALTAPATLSYTPSSTLLKTFGVQEKQIAPIQITLESLSLPSLDKWETLALSLKWKAPALTLSNLFWDATDGDLTVQTLQKIAFDVKGTSVTGSGVGSLQKEGELFKLKLNALFPTFVFTSPDKKRSTALADTAFTMEMGGKKESLDLKLTSRLQDAAASNIAMDLHVDGIYNHLPISDLAANARLQIESLPTSFADLLLGYQTGTLGALIGPELRLTLAAKSMKAEKSVQIQATSSQLNAQGAVTLKDDRLFLTSARTPMEFYFTLTKEGYAALDRMRAKDQKGSIPYELKEPSVFSLTLSRLNCPLSKKKLRAFPLLTWT